MSNSEISLQVQQALLGFFQAAVPLPSSGGNFRGEVDRDPFKTRYPRFYSLEKDAQTFSHFCPVLKQAWPTFLSATTRGKEP